VTVYRRRPVRTGVLALLFAATAGFWVQSSATSVEIRVEGGLVSVEARDAPVAGVIRAIGEQGGFETIVVGDVNRSVSASFADVPLRNALARLLGDTNHVVVHDTGHAIVRLWLLGSGGTVTSLAPANPPMTVRVPTVAGEVRPQDETVARSLAVLQLTRSGAAPAVLEALGRALLEDADALVRTRAAMALGSLGDERALPVLQPALADENGSVRTQVIQALGLIGGEPATRVLGDILLQGGNSSERIVASRGLARQDTELARQYLDTAANDPDQRVRAAAERALASGSRDELQKSRGHSD
jgi:HEAT repeat protein